MQKTSWMIGLLATSREGRSSTAGWDRAMVWPPEHPDLSEAMAQVGSVFLLRGRAIRELTVIMRKLEVYTISEYEETPSSDIFISNTTSSV
jgi:hypothetical protein